MGWDDPQPVEMTPMEASFAIGALRSSQEKAAAAGDWDDVDTIGVVLERLHSTFGLPVPGA